MSNLFSMVTLRSSLDYTYCAIESFFKNTQLKEDDEFLLIDNDGCELKNFYNNKKIKIIKNKFPLSFAGNANQSIDQALEKKKDLIFLNNDIIFTKDWFQPVNLNSKSISIPANNQIFPYVSDCGSLKIKPVMNLKDFNNSHELLNEIVKKHKEKYKLLTKAQSLLMGFFCFKIPNHIMNEVGHFDEVFVHGGEDVDYRIRCAKKGYEVDYISQSYLIHFYGKSSWDGVETEEETKKRNKNNIQEFSKKWGKEMAQIFILRKDFQNIIVEKGLNEILEKGKYGDLIRKLLK